jgi:hypothetical protein
MNVGLLRLQSAPIWKYLQGWWAEEPEFAWAPTGGATGFVDLVSGAPLMPLNGAVVVPGGIVNTAYSTSPVILQSYTTIVNSVSNWGVMALVSGLTGSQRGMILKVGSGTTGLGLAVGNTDETTAGTKILLLKEAVAWAASASTNAWVDGANAIWLQATGSGSTAKVWPSDIDVTSSGTYNQAAGNIFINGRTLGGANNSSNFTVHCVFLFKNRWVTGAEEIAFRTRLVAQVQPLMAMPREQIMRMFVPSPFFLPYVAAGGGAPATFTDLKATAITSSSVQATYDYAF